MKKSFFFLTACLLFASCSDNTIIDEPIIEEIENPDNPKPSDVVPIPRRDIVMNSVETSLQGQQLDFSTSFFKTSLRKNVSNNFIISPLSASMALSMLSNGAGGNSARELVTVLLSKESELKDLNEFNQRMRSELTSLDNLTTIEIANAFFYQNGINIKNQFLDVNKTFYNVLNSAVDFRNESAFSTINKWVSDATHGLINEIPLSSVDNWILANAIYFKSSWSCAFSEAKTKDTIFNNADNTKSTVKMMEGNNYNYSLEDKFVIIELPYGNNAFSMYIACSNDDKDISLEGIDNIITKENMVKFIKSGKAGNGYIKIPRFEISQLQPISDILSNMGIKDIFSDKADLSGIIEDSKDHPIQVFQNCGLKVNETGSEGAAVTFIRDLIAPLDGPQIEPKSFTVDRPFVFWIAEKSTGTMLFMGQIAKM